MRRKLITIGVFVLLLAVSVFAAAWWLKYRNKNTASSTAPANNTPPTPSNNTNNTNSTPTTNNNTNNPNDPDIGLEAYAGEALAIYDKQLNVVKNVNANTDIGKITGTQGTDYFIINDTYLVKRGSIIAR